MLVTILPNSPDFVDVSMVTEEQRIGGRTERSDVATQEIVRVCVWHSFSTSCFGGRQKENGWERRVSACFV